MTRTKTNAMINVTPIPSLNVMKIAQKMIKNAMTGVMKVIKMMKIFSNKKMNHFYHTALKNVKKMKTQKTAIANALRLMMMSIVDSKKLVLILLITTIIKHLKRMIVKSIKMNKMKIKITSNLILKIIMNVIKMVGNKNLINQNLIKRRNSCKRSISKNACAIICADIGYPQTKKMVVDKTAPMNLKKVIIS